MNYSKSTRKQLKQLAANAYEKELCSELKQLSKQFMLWNEGKIDVWTLEEAVHQFHNVTAKKLYGRYMELPPEMIVPYALANGLISFNDIPQEIAEEMRMKSNFFSSD